MDTFVRYLHVMINILFVIVGILFTGFGLYIRFSSGAQELLSDNLGNIVLVYGSMSIGAVVLAVGACGALGYCYKSRVLLYVNIAINTIFLIAEGGAIAWVVIKKDNLKSDLDPVWKGLKNDTKYLLQDRFNCCGYSDHSEWGKVYPSSCFNDSVSENATIWSRSCYDAIISFLDENVILAAAIVGFIVLLQVLDIIIACFLLRELKQRNQELHGGTLRNNYFAVREQRKVDNAPSSSPYW